MMEETQSFELRALRTPILQIAALILLASLLRGLAGSQSAAPDHVVAVPVANMYSAPTEDADVVSQAIIGTNVVTLESHGD